MLTVSKRSIRCGDSCRTISAWTANSAWRKFCRLYYRDPLPCREDFTISREKES